MERGILKSAALAAFMSLGASSAEPPSANSDSSIEGPLAGMIRKPAPSEVVAILAWGEHTMFRNIQRQTTFIRRVATEAERRLAEQRAAAHYAKLSQAEKTEIKKKKRYWAVPVTKAKPTPKPTPKPPSGERPPEKEPKVAAREDDIMIYDVASGRLVNNYVYTIENIPSNPMSLDGIEPVLYVPLYVGR